jgi:HEAT repeat protein
MIKATFIAVALAVGAVSTEAQNPTPAPAPVPPPASPAVTPAQPSPTPRAKRAPVLPKVWRSDDLLDLENRLDALKDMDFDLVTPAIPPIPPIEPMLDMDMDLDLGTPSLEMEGMLDALSDLDLDVEMPPMPSMPPMLDLAPMSPIAIEPMLMPMELEPMAPMAPMAIEPITPMPSIPSMPDISSAPAIAARALSRAAIEDMRGQSPFERQFSGISSEPQESWNQSDPADSLYRLAREALNRGEYRRAAQLFAEITQKFPSSAYASDARYWRAFALYRIGSSNDLRDALAALRDSGRGYRQASLQTDAPVLAARIQSALAAQGDGDARRAVSQAASQPGAACDREDLAVRVEALNSLGQTDPESTTPILRRLLARRDDCSATLRRAAIYILGRRTDDEARNLVIGAARNDPDVRVRADALRFLAAMPGDQAVATIEELARTPGNEQLQREAIRALGRSDNPRAKQSLRNIVERTDLSENLRITALTSVDSDHSPDNGAYIRAAYPRLETPRLKAAAIQAASRIGGSDNDQWLLSIVRNQNEPSDVRAVALRAAGRSTIPMGDLAKMYDVAGDRPLREQLIRLYAERTEPEATDKLLDIARTGTDPDMRRYAISALSRKNDPRTKKLLLEIIDK